MRILIIDDELRFATILKRILVDRGFSEVVSLSSAEEALAALAVEDTDLVITDLRLPKMSGIDLLGAINRSWPATQVILMTAYSDVQTAREALKRGAIDYLVKPFDNAELLTLIDQVRSRLSSQAQNDTPDDAVPLAGMIGVSPAIKAVFGELRRIALSDASVLIQGESGTGKELAARAVHQLGPRHAGPFIEVNTGALPENVIENELFGHERGAFTGADDRKQGLCELAAGGTLFLDEIGEMPLHLQPRLLRFLQERRFYRVGGTEPVMVDVRVVAATNRDLEEEVLAGRFREDLYYRLDVASVSLPSLKDRREDIPLLIDSFISRHRHQVTFEQDAMEALQAYDWPGNIRELQNVVERCLIMVEGGVIGFQHLPRKITSGGTETSGRYSTVVCRRKSPEQGRELEIEENERRLIEQALSRSNGNKTQAAELLGITRRRIYSRIKLLGIKDGPA